MVAVRYEQSRPASYPFLSTPGLLEKKVVATVASSVRSCLSVSDLPSNSGGHVSVSPVGALPNIPLPLQRIKPGPGREDPLASPQR